MTMTIEKKDLTAARLMNAVSTAKRIQLDAKAWDEHTPHAYTLGRWARFLDVALDPSRSFSERMIALCEAHGEQALLAAVVIGNAPDYLHHAIYDLFDVTLVARSAPVLLAP